MKHAVIMAHPKGRAFTRLIADTYSDAVRARGHEALFRDLYAMDFDPRLRAEEIPGPDGAAPAPDVVAERALLADVDVFAFVYPIWFGAPPAILKGYVERVFGVGFAYRNLKAGGSEPLLTGRKMISFTSSGSENTWLGDSGHWEAVRQVFDKRLQVACGLEPLDHVNHGGVDDDLPPEKVEEAVAGVRRIVSELF